MEIKTLKDKILQLAMEGKLVEQNENEESGIILLEKIKKVKNELIKNKSIKKEKSFLEILDEEKIFELPSGWAWCRLGEVVQLNPRNKIEEEVEVSFIPMSLLNSGYSSLHKDEIRMWKDVKSGFTHFAENDVAVAKITPCFENRKSAIMTNLKNTVGAGTTELYILRPYNNLVLPQFIYNIIISKAFIDGGKLTYTGTAGQQRVKKEFIENYIIAIPPLEEQRRIVDKVENLFQALDELEKNKQELLQNISDIRRKVLQLAIKGKLVEQDKNAESISDLLNVIRAEKEQLIKEKKIRKRKSPLKLVGEEIKNQIPRGWAISKLDDVIQLISGQDISLGLCNDEQRGIPYIMGASNMTSKGMVIERWIEKPTVIGRAKDIIISVKGTVGKLDILELEEVHLSRQVMSIRCLGQLYNRYIFIFLQFFMNELKGKSTGVIPGISREDILNIAVPLPPLDEQKRIVEKFDSIMDYLDELELQMKG